MEERKAGKEGKRGFFPEMGEPSGGGRLCEEGRRSRSLPMQAATVNACLDEPARLTADAVSQAGTLQSKRCRADDAEVEEGGGVKVWRKASVGESVFAVCTTQRLFWWTD